MLNLQDDRMAYIRRKLADIAVATNMDAFKSMKKKLVLTFGESNVQIVRLDEEEIERRLADGGHRSNTLRQIDISDFKQLVDLSSALYFITIRLPEVKVSNSRGESITIRDMFVRLKVRPNGTLVPIVEGLVASYTKRQALARYQHSHLRGLPDVLRSKPFFNNFCLGTGPINQVLTLLAQEYNEVNFQLLCLHIKSLVEWESLEGTPYMYLAGVGSSGAPAALLAQRTINTACERIRRRFYEMPAAQSKQLISMTITDHEIQVSSTEELEKWVGRTIPTILGVPGLAVPVENLLVQKNQQGQCYKYTNTINTEIHPTTQTILVFRGEDIKVKIIDDEQHLNPTAYGHPEIVKQLCQRIGADLTASAFEYGQVTEQNTSDPQRQVAVANNDAVPANISS